MIMYTAALMRPSSHPPELKMLTNSTNSNIDIKEIKRRFSEVRSSQNQPVGVLTTNLAKWIEIRKDSLDQNDIALLEALGRALHLMEMEDKWQRCWE